MTNSYLLSSLKGFVCNNPNYKLSPLSVEFFPLWVFPLPVSSLTPPPHLTIDLLHLSSYISAYSHHYNPFSIITLQPLPFNSSSPFPSSHYNPFNQLILSPAPHTITIPFPSSHYSPFQSTHPLPCTSPLSSNLCHIPPTLQCYHLNHPSDPIKYGKPYTKHTCTNRSCNKKCNHSIKQILHVQTNISQTWSHNHRKPHQTHSHWQDNLPHDLDFSTTSF